MASYAVSFELESNSTYSARYSSLMAQIRATSMTWTETTSFALVQTSETLAELESRLYYRSELSSLTDILLVIDPATSSAIGRGPIKYPNLLKANFRYCLLR